jgi:hypothetical protein
LQICLEMAGGELLVGIGEVKVSMIALACLHLYVGDQRVFTAGGAMSGYQFGPRVVLAPD